MAIPSRVMASGNSAGSTGSICGGVANTLTATGTTNADALGLSAETNVVTTAATGTGVRLMPIEVVSRVTVVNLGANALLVYPGTGVQINALTATTGGFSVPAGKVADFIGVSPTQWVALLGA
ncbi:hypothetical protein LMG7053_05247 [Achromobacter ruhlandii]|uniref:Uncharacterized protein n=2 Tax=Achromobacter ruhlandii TaxID=72557 RepID=A0ABM8M2W7_9BURK|nr:hypothetical protein [Achromobacter ruhlandii]CAB3957299.1 hypothetical protein LMG7053_05247 [Achromobacter ruhlandii]